MNVTDINEARRRREEQRARIQRLADWAMTVPFTVNIPDHPEFRQRFPEITFEQILAAGIEIERRAAQIVAEGFAPDGAAGALQGRRERSVAAARWLNARPHITQPLLNEEFRTAFADLTRAELGLAIVELQRIARGLQR